MELRKALLAGMLTGTCIVLCSCTSELSNTPTILDNQADFSVKISLPYATVSSDRGTTEQTNVQALEIDDSGKVTVNDQQSVLREGDATQSSSSNYKSLRQGNTGLAVQVLQSRLSELGYYTSNVSGIFDSETEAAVRKFEQTYGTMQTGVATADLQERLYAADAIAYGTDAYNSAVLSQYRILQFGDSGSGVYALQQRLRTLGYPITALTGTFDEQTARAVGLFYEAYGLKYNEVANVALQQELYSDRARTYAGDISVNVTEVEESDETSNFVAVTLNNTLELQQRLIGLGYLKGEASGTQDAQTVTAIKLLQEACGLEPNGEPSQEVIDLLNRADVPTFKEAYGRYENLLEGSGGDAVIALQERLIALGFVTGTANGDYGRATSAAVTLFQAANNLEETGVAMQYDQAVMFSSFVKNINGEEIFRGQQAVTANAEGSDADNEAAGSAVNNKSVAVMLAQGSSGDAVLQLQYRLTELGYVSSITAEYDAITSRAVEALQVNIGVEPNGSAGATLLTFVYSDAAPNSSTRLHEETQNFRTLSVGESGSDVEALQKQLWQLGYLDQNAINAGSFDEVTQQAVIDVQTALHYAAPDGIAGAELQCWLFSENAEAIQK